MKIFITGGTGFVGSHLLKHACSRGVEVTALRREGSRPRIPLGSMAPIWINGDLDTLELKDLSDHDALIHLASVGVSPQKATLEELIHWNVSATGRLIEMAALAGIRRVVVAGSYAEYGLSANNYDFLPANAPLQPTSLYAASKAASCMIAFALAEKYKIELCYPRIFSAYGVGQHQNNFFSALTGAAGAGKNFPMTQGEQVRDFVPVEDVAKSLLYAANRNDVIPGRPLIFNVASGQPQTLREFAEAWWSRLNASGRLLIGAIPYRGDEPMRYAADMTPGAVSESTRQM